jgi:tight adherence protein B
VGTLIGVGLGIGVVLILRTVVQLNLPAKPKSKSLNADWPSFVDDVASGVRAGMSLAEAIFEAGSRLPNIYAAKFLIAKVNWQGEQSFLDSMHALEAAIPDTAFTSFQRTIEIGYLQGGSNLPTVLNQLAHSLRVSRQLANEIRGRQAVTINSAKVAVGAPFLVLLVTGSRQEVRDAYLSPTGVLVLLGVVLASAISYMMMQYLARMPEIEEIR